MNSSLNPLDRFLAIPNRDAYATIRGFLYQAVLTIQAWLRLSATEILELEAGEDIDWRSLADENVSSRKDVDRVLGQVKFRGTGLSLRSEISLASLVNFHEHRVRNPQFQLQFRFISNAKIIQERGHTHLSGLKGIELWTSLKTLTDPVDRADRLAFLRRILLAPSEPASIDRKKLADFRSFVRTSSNEEFLEFVRKFTWMKSSSDLESALALAEQEVRTRRELCGFEQAAPFCLQTLLQHVLQVLSQPSVKELRPVTCSELLLSSQKHVTEAVAQGLASAREKITLGADTLLNQTQRLDKIIRTMGNQAALVELAVDGVAGSAVVLPGKIAPILDPPNLVSPTAPRRGLRQKIALERKSKGAVALIGDIACGKSQLARLSAEGIDNVIWLSLRANEGIDPSILLDIASLKCFDASLGEGASSPEGVPSRILIIDDLEIGLGSRKFVDRLLLIARSLLKQNVFLVVCSTRRLPSSLQDQFPTIAIGSYEDEDIRALLDARGAPPRLNNDRFRALISSVTGAHPLLVGSLIQFLLQRQWKIDDDGLQALLSRSFAQDIREEMQARLLNQESSGTKELLYRVSLATRPITQDQALTLAEITPAIPRRNEELTTLLDTWLQRSGNSRVLVSPLVANIGETNLSTDVRRRVHDRLAGWILKSDSMTQADAVLCISHLIAAGKERGAGLVLLQGLQAMLPVAKELKDTSLLRIWQDLPLPAKMSIEIRLIIRGYQTAIAGLLGENVDYGFQDLLGLAKQVSGELGHLCAFGACSTVAINLAKQAPSLALQAAVIAIEHDTQLSQVQREELDTDFGLAGAFWLIGVGCSTREQIRDWLIQLGRIPEARREALRSSDIANLSAWMIFQKLWLAEQKKPEANRNWSSLLAFLEECEVLAAKASVSVLEASGFRAQQSIRIVHLKEIEDGDLRARRRVEDFLKGGSEDFLISEGTAIWLTDVDRWELALPWFNRASACALDGLDSLRMQNQLRRAEALYRAGQDPESAFEEALNIAEESEELGDLDIVLCLVEKAMWQWLKGDRTGCLYSWDRALELILGQDRSSTRWKNLFVLMGNHTSFFSTADLKNTTHDDVTPPTMGIYLRDYDISGLYSDGSAWFVLATMALFADNLGEADLASKWAIRTVETADSLGADPKSRFVLRVAVPPLLKARDYDGAITFARDSALTATIRPQFNVSAEMRAMRPQLSASAEDWKPVDSEQAEGWAIVTAVLPALIDIVTVSITDEPTAYTLLGSLTEKCLQIATQQGSPSWRAAAKALTDLGTGEIDWSLEFTSAPNSDRSAVVRELLLAFGSGFDCRRVPRDVFIQQARWTAWLRQYFETCRSLSAYVARGLSNYWTAVFEKNAFYFASPRETKREFSEAARKQRVDSVFRAVAKSLSLTLPQWLSVLLRDA
jgi:hypothetical protein